MCVRGKNYTPNKNTTTQTREIDAITEEKIRENGSPKPERHFPKKQKNKRSSFNWATRSYVVDEAHHSFWFNALYDFLYRPDTHFMVAVLSALKDKRSLCMFSVLLSPSVRAVKVWTLPEWLFHLFTNALEPAFMREARGGGSVFLFTLFVTSLSSSVCVCESLFSCLTFSRTFFQSKKYYMLQSTKLKRWITFNSMCACIVYFM